MTVTATPRFSHFIAGEHIDGEGAPVADVNPADTSDVLGHFRDGSAQDVLRAVDAARTAFPAWRATPAPERGRIIARAAELVAAQREDLARLLTREEGKPLAEARGEIGKGMHLLEFYAGEGFRLGGVTRSSEMRNTLLYTVREPLGVVGLITPWNFPWAIPVWKVAPALVAGNTCVLKPSELTPLVALKLAEILTEAGLPRGVLNVVLGQGPEVGGELVRNRAVRAISFTGSTPTGLAIYAEAARRGIKVTCEMGGKNPAVVLADADLDQAAQGVADGAFGSTGQRCTATSRLIVERSVEGPLLERILARARAYRIGNGFDPEVNLGPLVSQRQLDGCLRHIERAVQQGAELCCGGTRLTDGPLANGYFVAPTVLRGTRPEHELFRQEVFGPVLAITTVGSLEEAIALCNDSDFGLTSAIYSRDVNTVMQFVAEVQTGMVHVNSPTVGGEAQVPFGGIKASAVGEREMAEEGIRFFTELKTVFHDFTGAVRRTNIY